MDGPAAIAGRENILNAPRTQKADIATEITWKKLAKSGFSGVHPVGIEPMRGHV
jgi:hypothetical protein